jgi:hypothetical protein
VNSHSQATARTVRCGVVLEAPIEQAFRVFPEDFDRFKPREHNMLEVEIAETVFEPRGGGRLYDRGVDGSECQWARVSAFEAPTPVDLEHRNLDRHGEGWEGECDAVASEGGWPLYLHRFGGLFGGLFAEEGR